MHATMISFPCPCGKHRFDLPNDEAGSLVQCPVCSRLNDVPTLSELSQLDVDGTLKVSDEEPDREKERNRLAEQLRVFGKKKTTSGGEEIDLRQTFDDLRRAGAEETPLDLRDELRPRAPKYDPITGELIQPLDVAPVKARKVLPVSKTTTESRAMNATAYDAATRRQGTIGYAPARTAAREGQTPLTFGSLPLRLFEPINLMVMIFVGVASLFGSVASIFPLMGGFFLLYTAPFAVGALTLAHYANCIEDLGPGAQEELPRPLRSLEFGADLWWPFVHMFSTIAICFGPAITLVANTPDYPPIRFVGGITLLFGGACLFPVVALILCASGHYGNLRPDRVINTILVFGWTYLPTVFITLVALIFNAAAGIGVVVAIASTFAPGTTATWTFMGIAAAAALVFSAVATYFSHLTVWWLGLLYQRHEDHLPWEFQEHERMRAEHKRLKVLAEIEKSRRR